MIKLDNIEINLWLKYSTVKPRKEVVRNER